MRHFALLSSLLLVLAPGCRPTATPPGPLLERLTAVELPAAERDLAVACLVTGSCDPPFEALTVREQDDVLESLGRTLHAYGAPSFASFLALRRRDLSHARWARAEDVEVLLGHARRLGVPVTGDEDWLEALEAFWYAYYARPPVARWLPERASVTLGELGAPSEEALAAWEEDYERRLVATGLPTVEATLAVPHRRTLVQSLGLASALRWIEIQLAFESTCDEPMRLWMRFAHDTVGEEWFLHRATTLYPPDSQGPCNLVL